MLGRSGAPRSLGAFLRDFGKKHPKLNQNRKLGGHATKTSFSPLKHNFRRVPIEKHAGNVPPHPLSFFFSKIIQFTTKKLRTHVKSLEDQVSLREQLSYLDLVAFVGNDAILPRRSGVDDRPMSDGIPFKSTFLPLPPPVGKKT